MNLPNRLTIFRIVLVPIMVIVPYIGIKGNFFGIPISLIVADIVFIIASITDKLDGTIARKNNLVTTFGKFLDPIADKILVLAALIILVDFGKIPAWIPIVVLFREFLVSGFRLVASKEGGTVIAASNWGKLKTVTQMIAIIAVFVDVLSFGEFLHVSPGNDINIFQYIINVFSSFMMGISVVATIVSGWKYLKSGKELFKDN